MHGVKGVTAGQIIVSAIEYENDFVISVFNNGNSADKKKIEDLLKGEKNQRAVTGIGLYNVNSRLKLLYGESYGLIYNEKVRNGFRNMGSSSKKNYRIRRKVINRIKR